MKAFGKTASNMAMGDAYFKNGGLYQGNLHYDTKHNMGEYTFLDGERSKGYYKSNSRYGEREGYTKDKRRSKSKYSQHGFWEIEY